jgi:hypothetical protein
MPIEVDPSQVHSIQVDPSQVHAMDDDATPPHDSWDPRTWDLTHNPVSNALAGAGAGVISTGVGAYNLARKIPGAAAILPAPNTYVQALTQAPAGPLGSTGKFLEQAAEFAVPAGIAADLTRGAGLAARVVTQALAGGGVSAVQSGGNPASIVTGAALGAAGPVAGAALDAAAPSVGRVAAQVLGRTTGAGPASIAQAIENPSSDLVAAMRGQTSENEVLDNFKTALQSVKDTRAADYQNALGRIPQNITLDPTPIQQNINYMLGQFGVKPGAKGALDFSRSTVTDPIAQRQIKNIVSDVADWGSQPGDLTPAGMDTLKRRIGNMVSPDSQGSAFIASTRDAANQVLKDNVPGYADMTKGYETVSKLIDSMGDLSINSANPGTAIRKLSTVMSQDNGYRQALTDALGQYANTDLKGQLAGAALSKGGPQGIASALDTGVGLLGLTMHGYLSPMAAISMAAASPRLMGELVIAMGKAAPFVKAAGPSIGAIAPAVANATLNPAPRPAQ